MDPPSTSINEILHRKAQEAWIDPDNYNDILRYFPLMQNPAGSVAIDLDEPDTTSEQERTENNSGYRPGSLT
ncbi:unnamed protein product [Rotaria magnacalcarata]|uniref:Uncharacterized protein n=1 Tax=Rotaria magnacalcarata TaxID=392030 RepID=A0A8S2KPH2_9BILA|nr:unnamed protein product [Rotaria magnacalcarata]